jgi:hypothetical protein
MQKERAAGVVWKLHTPCLEATCQALRSTPSSASLLAITGGASSGAEATGGHCSRVRPGLTDAGSRSRNAPASPEDVQRRERCANLRVAAFCCESKCGEVREVGPSKCVGARRSAEAAPRRGELPRVMPRVVPCSAWPGALLGGVRNVYQRTSKPISHCDIIYQNVISGAASADGSEGSECLRGLRGLQEGLEGTSSLRAQTVTVACVALRKLLRSQTF